MKFIIMLLLAASPLYAQWTKVATTGQAITSIPIGTIVRYGTGTTWVMKDYTSTKSFIVGPGEYPGLAIPAAPYELDVWQTPLVQTITVAGIPITVNVAVTAPVNPGVPIGTVNCVLEINSANALSVGSCTVSQ